MKYYVNNVGGSRFFFLINPFSIEQVSAHDFETFIEHKVSAHSAQTNHYCFPYQNTYIELENVSLFGADHFIC